MPYHPREPAFSDLKLAKRLSFPVDITVPFCGWVGCRVASQEAAVVLGPPMLTDETDGCGTGDLWAYEFRCGLKLAIQIPHMTCYPGEIWIDSLEIDHALRHLPFHIDDLSPMHPEAIAEMSAEIIQRYPQRETEVIQLKAFQVWRIDDNGNVFTVGEPTSERDARCLVAQYEARGHKQMYWVARAK
jgi:hypothetical protein